MKTKNQQLANNPCGVCGQELHETTVTHEEKRNGNIFIFENVPALICDACGEVWIEETTLQEIERLIKEGRPSRKVETPVFDFRLATAK